MEAGLNVIFFYSSSTLHATSHSKETISVSNTIPCVTNVPAAKRMHHFDGGEMIRSAMKKRGRETVALRQDVGNRQSF